MPQSLHDCIFFLLGTLRLLRIFIFRFMHYAMQNSIGIPSMHIIRLDGYVIIFLLQAEKIVTVIHFAYNLRRMCCNDKLNVRKGTF